MKLSDMFVLPSRAGLAEIRFTEATPEATRAPQRNGAEIVLPNDPRSEFFPLKNGEQFLFQFTAGRQIWFGGTDEQPFLTQLDNDILRAFKKEGELGLYEALKPQLVRDLERLLGVVTKRQGDIFAVPLPFSWEDIKRFASLALIVAPFIHLGGTFMHCLSMWRGRFAPWKGNVFGTRHVINASCATAEVDMEMFLEKTHYIIHKAHMLAEGVLVAPDHVPLKLCGVHVLVQADGLFDPERAD